MSELRLIAAAWLKAAAACSEHLGVAAAYSFALLALAVRPDKPDQPPVPPPGWLDEMNRVRETE